MSDYDPTDFVDNDFQAHKAPHATATVSSALSQRALTREEVDSQVMEKQQKLAELKRAQEELERERASLEETRRRQMEFQTGRQEMIQNLTRGLGLLEEAEFATRRDSEQMAKSLVELREALAKVQAIHEESWGRENFAVELTRALTTLENARMEWNGARLKFQVLSQPNQTGGAEAFARGGTGDSLFDRYTFSDLCRLGFALTWPLAAVGALAFGVLLVLLMRH